MKPPLSVVALSKEAARFAALESTRHEASIYGVDNGKSIGTYFEHKFRDHLCSRYTYAEGNSAKGIDWPELGVDMKFTSIKQPQSSCPYRSARQKIFGLGYALLLFVYEKSDDHDTKTGTLDIRHTVFIEKHRTGDFQMTSGLRQILANDGNAEDLIAFMMDRNLPVEEVEANRIAQDLLRNPPDLGVLTISNALQWRLQYGRAIEQAGTVTGVLRLR